MSDAPRTINDLVLFAAEVIGGRPHSKKEATEFFRDLVAWDETRANEFEVAAHVAGGSGIKCPVPVRREGNNSIFLGSEANRFYTLAEARALAAEIVRVAK
jgi:hypothetical protein